MNKFLISLILFIFSFNFAQAETMTFSISPVILPTYSDISFTGEMIMHPSHTFSGFFNRNSKDCSDCKDSGKSTGVGLGGFYRFYFNTAATSSWYFELGLSRFNGKVTEDSSDKTVKKSVWEKTLSFGNRVYFYNSLFYEWKVGLLDRSNEIKAGSYTGYRKTTPLIGFSLGMKF